MKINFKMKYMFFIIFLFVALISVGFSMWNIEGPGTGSIDSSVQTENVGTFESFIGIGEAESFSYCALGSTVGFVQDGTKINSNTEIKDTGTITIPLTVQQAGSYTIVIEATSTTGLAIFTDDFKSSISSGSISHANGNDKLSSKLTITLTKATVGQKVNVVLSFTLNDSLKEELVTTGVGFLLSFSLTQN